MPWRRAIIVGTVVLGVIGLWGTPPLSADGLQSATTEEKAATSSASAKIQGSLKRLMDQAGDATSLSIQLNGKWADESILPDVLTNDGFRVVVEATSDDALSALLRRITELGGQVEGVARSRFQAGLSSSVIQQLAADDHVRFIRMPMSPIPGDPRLTVQMDQADDEIRSEGLNSIGADVWHEIGLTGQGVRVGIIDSGFKDYKRLLGTELPDDPNVTTRSFRSDEDIECSDCPETGQYHGLGTAEVVHDVAPRSQLLLSNFGTDVQFEQGVNWMIEQDVDVINTSLGFPSGCFREGGGIFEPLIKKARNAGITWATSAGNEGTSHWQGTYRDSDDDGQHNFTDDDNTFTVEAELIETRVNGRTVASAVLSFLLSWDADCTDASHDFDIRIIPEDDSAREVSGSWAWGPGVPIRVAFDVFQFPDADAGDTKTFEVVIEKRDPDSPDVAMDMLIRSCTACVDGDFDYLTPDGSVSILEPAISSSAMTVGAHHHDAETCGDLCPEGSLLGYSSRGPTKDGRTKPDIAAPTHVSTAAFGSWNRTGDNQNFGFTGTSAASPHVAGAAALAQQVIPDGDPGQLIDFLKRRSEDLGAPGADNLYGAGALSLGPLPLDPTALNVTGITPERALAGQQIEAVITGTGLTKATDVVFEGGGVSATIRDGATANELPITLRISSGAAFGPRRFRVIGETQEAASGRVALSVIGPPRFGVSPEELAYDLTVGDTSAPIRMISIENAGDGPLDWTARTTQSWVSVNPTSGSTPTEIMVLLSPGGVASGVHRAQIVLEADGAANSPFRIDVVLNVQQPELNVDPQRLVFETTFGGSPDAQTLAIRNNGAGRLRWGAVPQQPWIRVNATSGSGSFDLVVSVDPDELGPGTHRGSIRIEASQADNSPITVPVIVRVQGPEELFVVEFTRIEFESPQDWRRIVGNVCVVYRNASDGYRTVHVTPTEGERESYHVPSGNDVVVCGNVVHIDTRLED